MTPLHSENCSNQVTSFQNLKLLLNHKQKHNFVLSTSVFSTGIEWFYLSKKIENLYKIFSTDLRCREIRQWIQLSAMVWVFTSEWQIKHLETDAKQNGDDQNRKEGQQYFVWFRSLLQQPWQHARLPVCVWRISDTTHQHYQQLLTECTILS